MSEYLAELFIEVLLDGEDHAELDELTRQLKAEVEDLSVDSVEDVTNGSAPDGTKALDITIIGQMVVTLAPAIIPPLFELLKSWVERKPSTPVKIRVKVGKRTALIEYDPTKTSAQELEVLVKTLGKSLKA
ncbi:MAG: hypothetical protein HOP27_15725 [Anaerolineales bacterium]|nr:hypothetical protein [Anaerolineales bacterium]